MLDHASGDLAMEFFSDPRRLPLELVHFSLGLKQLLAGVPDPLVDGVLGFLRKLRVRFLGDRFTFLSRDHNEAILIPDQGNGGIVFDLFAEFIHGGRGFLAALLVYRRTPPRHIVGLECLRDGFLQVGGQGVQPSSEKVPFSSREFEGGGVSRILEVESVTPGRRGRLLLGPCLQFPADESPSTRSDPSQSENVVSLRCNGDPESEGFHGFSLSEGSGQGLDFGGGFETEGGGITTPVQLFSKQFRGLRHFGSFPGQVWGRASGPMGCSVRAMGILMGRVGFRALLPEDGCWTGGGGRSGNPRGSGGGLLTSGPINRGARIRTGDLRLPKPTRYRTAPHPAFASSRPSLRAPGWSCGGYRPPRSSRGSTSGSRLSSCAARLEPGTFGSQSRRATGLRHTPLLPRLVLPCVRPDGAAGASALLARLADRLLGLASAPVPLGSNRGPSAPKADALPDCATPRLVSLPYGVTAVTPLFGFPGPVFRNRRLT